MDNKNVDEAKKIAQEKFEEAKKIALEKATVAKQKFLEFSIKQKIIAGSVAAAVLVGLVAVLTSSDTPSSGSSSQQTASQQKTTSEISIFKYDGDCEVGEQVEEDKPNNRTVMCVIDNGNGSSTKLTILEQHFHGGNRDRISAEKKYDIVETENGDYVTYSTSLVSDETFSANKMQARGAYYVTKNEQSLQTKEIKYAPNGKPYQITTYSVNQNEDGNWVSLLKEKVSYFEGTENVSEKNLYDVKQNADGTWAQLATQETSYKQGTNDIRIQKNYGVEKNQNGKWASLLSEEINNYSSNGSEKKYVIKENGNGGMVSLIEKETYTNGGYVTYEILKDDYANWGSFKTEELSIVDDYGKTTRTTVKFEIKKNDDGKYVSLEKSNEKIVNKKEGGTLKYITEKELLKSDSGKWGSFTKEYIIMSDERIENRFVHKSLKNNTGDYENLRVYERLNGAEAGTIVILTYEPKQGNDGRWRIYKSAVSYFKSDADVQSDTPSKVTKYDISKKDDGSWESKEIKS